MKDGKKLQQGMRRARKLIIPMLISIPCLFLFAQCHIGAIAPILTGKKIWLSDKPQLVEQEILRQVSIGSSIETARDVMEQNGFECRYYKNETYYYRGTDAESRDIDFYACGLNKPWFLSNKDLVSSARNKTRQINTSFSFLWLCDSLDWSALIWTKVDKQLLLDNVLRSER